MEKNGKTINFGEPSLTERITQMYHKHRRNGVGLAMYIVTIFLLALFAPRACDGPDGSFAPFKVTINRFAWVASLIVSAVAIVVFFLATIRIGLHIRVWSIEFYKHLRGNSRTT